MKKVFILFDNDIIKNKILEVMSRMKDKFESVGSASSIHTAIIDVIKNKPDIVIDAMNEKNGRTRFFEKYTLIRVYDEERKIDENRCKIIVEEALNKALSQMKVEVPKNETSDEERVRKKTDLVVVGISTGGPYALKQLIPKIKNKINVPIFIVQHMPPGFTKEMAKGLNRISPLSIVEAQDKMEIDHDKCYIMPGGKNTALKNTGGKLHFQENNQKYGFYTPSIDYLLESILQLKEYNPLVAIMTGMGNDGFDGIRKLRHEKRGVIITQSKESCVVYGMPRVIDDAGMSDIVGLSVEKIAEEINRRV